MLKINIPTSPLPLRGHAVRSKKGILFITLESNSILSKQSFSSLPKFKLCICKNIIYFEAADVKLKKDMVLAGELQLYLLQKRKTRKNSGSDGIWTQASQNITTNWATEVNVNSSALMPIYFYRTLHSPWIFASVIFWSLSFKCFFKCV